MKYFIKKQSCTSTGLVFIKWQLNRIGKFCSVGYVVKFRKIYRNARSWAFYQVPGPGWAPCCLVVIHSLLLGFPLTINRNKTWVGSMIHSARPTVPPVAITILAWTLFCIARFWKLGTNGRTTRVKIVIPTGHDQPRGSKNRSQHGNWHHKSG